MATPQPRFVVLTVITSEPPYFCPLPKLWKVQKCLSSSSVSIPPACLLLLLLPVKLQWEKNLHIWQLLMGPLRRWDPTHTFVRAGHFFSFSCGVFYLAVIVEQKCLLLLKKLVNFLHGKHTQSEIKWGSVRDADWNNVMQEHHPATPPLFQREWPRQLSSPCSWRSHQTFLSRFFFLHWAGMEEQLCNMAFMKHFFVVSRFWKLMF